MTITARALTVQQMTDDTVTQVVRIFNNGNPVKDVPVPYPPGADQATAIANLTSVVKARLTRAMADPSTMVVPPGTFLDLTDPVVISPVLPPVGFDAWSVSWAAYKRLRDLFDDGLPGVTQQRVLDAKTTADALYQPAFEAFL